MTTLDKLSPGDRAVIVRVDGYDGISARLREMGFVAGQSIEFLRVAPLGDPLKCAIQGSRIAVRSGEAKRVCLEPVAS